MEGLLEKLNSLYFFIILYRISYVKSYVKTCYKRKPKKLITAS